MSAADVKAIVEAFKDTGEVKKVQSEGFYAGGQRYIVIRADDTRLYGKKVCGSPLTHSLCCGFICEEDRVLIADSFFPHFAFRVKRECWFIERTRLLSLDTTRKVCRMGMLLMSSSRSGSIS